MNNLLTSQLHGLYIAVQPSTRYIAFSHFICIGLLILCHCSGLFVGLYTEAQPSTWYIAFRHFSCVGLHILCHCSVLLEGLYTAAL
ncbi:hypothetical protein KP509_32G039100 [Ceratopteris richardii]|uniref:Cleaved adhesin domain-containing protein n=1 Tax=Ceratopteris richardii TaxID=49495 RepID=A0A8T2QSL6_CERRI|nr:hypothetical protein KP509_32G039100 [Ceratopteris richardii]